MLLHGDAVVRCKHRADDGVFDIFDPATLSQGFFVHFGDCPTASDTWPGCFVSAIDSETLLFCIVDSG